MRVPRLVIFGRDDRLVEPASEAAAYYRAHFGVPVQLVAGAEHSPMVEQPAAVPRLLERLDPR